MPYLNEVFVATAAVGALGWERSHEDTLPPGKLMSDIGKPGPKELVAEVETDGGSKHEPPGFRELR